MRPGDWIFQIFQGELNAGSFRNWNKAIKLKKSACTSLY